MSGKKNFLFECPNNQNIFHFLKIQLEQKKVLIPDGFLKKYIEEGYVRVDGQRIQSQQTAIRKHQKIEISIPLKFLKKFSKKAEPAIELEEKDILYEDEDIAVVNKPYGIPTHSTLDTSRDHLVAALKRFFKKRDNATPYLGLHHRLDRETSGCILFTKKQSSNKSIGDQFHDRIIKKTYLAISLNKKCPEKFKIESFLSRSKKEKKKMTSVTSGGDLAITHIKVLSRINKYILLEVQPETGRTHQIRVHLFEYGFPILGDLLYFKNGSEKYDRLLLHAYKIQFIHPTTQASIEVCAEMPRAFKDVIGPY